MAGETLWSVIAELKAEVEKHHKDLYLGNHLPSLTTRMLMVEDRMKRIEKNLTRATFLLIGLIITAIVDIVVRLIR